RQPPGQPPQGAPSPQILGLYDRHAAAVRSRDLRQQGLSYTLIAVQLTREGIPTRYGKPWEHSSVRYVYETYGRQDNAPESQGASMQTGSTKHLSRALSLGLLPGLGVLLIRTALVAAGTPARAAVYFSPKGGATDAVVREITAAQRQILVQAYSFTSVP